MNPCSGAAPSVPKSHVADPHRANCHCSTDSRKGRLQGCSPSETVKLLQSLYSWEANSGLEWPWAVYCTLSRARDGPHFSLLRGHRQLLLDFLPLHRLDPRNLDPDRPPRLLLPARRRCFLPLSPPHRHLSYSLSQICSYYSQSVRCQVLRWLGWRVLFCKATMVSKCVTHSAPFTARKFQIIFSHQ